MINGWIIYNGALKTDKILKLVHELASTGQDMGLRMNLLKNNQIMAGVDIQGDREIHFLEPYSKPDFIVFWDKDIPLGAHLEAMGYRIFNSSEAIRICDNKFLTAQKLADMGIRMPKTIVAPFVYEEQQLDLSYEEYLFDTFGFPFILKELQGSFGMQVHLIENVEAWRTQIQRLGNRPFLVQEFIKSSQGRDIRVNLIGEEIIGAMERHNPNDFRSNITMGGIAEPVQLSLEQREIALRAHRALKLDFSGLDLLFDQDGWPILCEVNSNLNYLSFEKASGINFSKHLLEYILKTLDLKV